MSALFTHLRKSFLAGLMVAVPLVASVGVLLWIFNTVTNWMLPAALRWQLGRTRALIFGLLLALSPTLWFVSREMGGAMLAWTLA
ncbi:MAG: hypothetical protein N2689_00850, partial [Verrucomicrobiae bacterium]|nr:hypothetical protein [Verrucomicrobiae bacterium]